MLRKCLIFSILPKTKFKSKSSKSSQHPHNPYIKSRTHQKPLIQRGEKANGFSAIFYQTLREELIPILSTLFQEMEREGTLHNSFFEAKITLMLKSHRDPTKKERKCQTIFHHEQQ